MAKNILGLTIKKAAFIKSDLKSNSQLTLYNLKFV